MPSSHHFDAIVIGGSAGSLEILRLLLPAVRAGMPPIAIVVHVPPNNPNLLPEALAPHCRIPLRHARDKERIESGTVYVAPAAHHLLMKTSRTFALSVDNPVNFSRPSIDVLFESAAHAYADKLLAILLSGANEDGAQGVKRVQKAGGMVIVQSPDSAAASLMPASAMRICTPNYVVPPKGILALLEVLLPPSELSGI